MLGTQYGALVTQMVMEPLQEEGKKRKISRFANEDEELSFLCFHIS